MILTRAFEIYNTAQNQTDQFWQDTDNLTGGPVTDDCGTVIAEGHMAYWQSTERYPNDPVRYNSNIGQDRYDLCGKYLLDIINFQMKHFLVLDLEVF